MILTTFGLSCPVAAQQVRPEQIALAYGESRAFGTVISHDGECHVLSVEHFLNHPGREIFAHRADRGAPATPNARILGLPPGAQGTVDARLARLSGWTSGCKASLGHVHDDRWSQILGTHMREGSYTSRLTIRLIDDQTISDVPIKLASTPEPDSFEFTLDPKSKGLVRDGAGISGSGIYYDGELVGIVTGAAVALTDGLRAARIEAVVSTLGLAVHDAPAPSEGSEPNTDSTAIAPDTTVTPVPEFPTECDELAANPGDSARYPGMPGVDFETIDVDTALAECEWAENEYPASPRLTYQLGRVYDAAYQREPANNPIGRALGKLNEALSAGHLAAIVNLEKLLLRDHPDCGGMKNCVDRYRRAIELLAKHDPVRAEIKRHDIMVYGPLSKQLCADEQKCLDDLARAYELRAPGTAEFAEAQAQIAYLMIGRGLKRVCPDDPGCLVFMHKAFSNRAAEGAGWATNWLGNLYARNDSVVGACADRKDCQRLAIATWTLAAERGDSWGHQNLGQLARNTDWQDAFDCKGAACEKLAFDYHKRAQAAGNATAAGYVVLGLLSNPEVAGCGGDECIMQARQVMQVQGFLDDAWHKSLLADAIDDHRALFSDLCEGRTCDAEIYRLHREAAELGNAFSMARVSDYYASIHPEADDAPPLARLTGCEDDAACLEEAIKWAQRAVDKGRTSELDDWFRLIEQLAQTRAETEPVDAMTQDISAAVLAWIAGAEAAGIGTNGYADGHFLWLLWNCESDTCAAIIDQGQAYQAAILAHARSGKATGEYINDLVGRIWCADGDVEICGPDAQILLALAASTGDVDALSALARAGDPDRRICPIEDPACQRTAPRTVRDMLAQLDMEQLIGLEFSLFNSYNSAAERPAPAWLVELLIAKGSTLLPAARQIKYLVTTFDNGGSYPDIPDDRVPAIVRDLLGAIGQGHHHGLRCQSALHLMYMQNHDKTSALTVDQEADLVQMFLMTCGIAERRNGDKWMKGRSKALAFELQRRLGVVADGVFFDASWAAAEALHNTFLLPVAVVVAADGIVAESPPAPLVTPASKTLGAWSLADLVANTRRAMLE